ncbi:hypothetical protein N3K63_11325 [Microbacterium sp. W1N]|uniref:hypothetical protein n=1 Tax=Microbacterium festucae TaxID=2977531 RepID=UPI0021BF166A|nr:hypothetical protein [Microbacterium festucae]MCT9820872.1 hypothetical protein [Microbacterium festucae]
MGERLSLTALGELLTSRRHLLAWGSTEREVAARVRAGEFVVVRRGWYVEQQAWAALWPEDRHRLHVLAVVRDGSGAGVVSHASAATLWGLPAYRVRAERVHLTLPAAGRISSGPDALRHVATLPEADVALVDGIRCTSLARTVFDALRTLPVEAALAVADAAERSVAVRGWEWDADAGDAWRHDLAARIDRAPGARGIRRARWIAEFADGRAESVLESVSRVQLWRVGFRRLRLQVPVRAPFGGEYRVDLGIDDVNVLAECDGRQKYEDEALRAGRSIDQVLLDEKRREDWIRGVTQCRLVRWEEPHARTPGALAARLASFGIRPPG